MSSLRSQGVRTAGLCAALLALAGIVPAAPAKPGPSSAPFLPGEVLVKFRPGASKGRDAARGHLQAQVRRRFRSGAEHWRLGKGVSTEAALSRLDSDPNVEYAEPNYIISLDLTPNDADYSQLYGLHNTGQEGGLPGADIDAEHAWDVTTGSRSVVVAVIDSGIDGTHPDLAANLWTNPGEIPGNRLDDDHNGYIDDNRGWDFVNDDNDPRDDHAHGTHCAGTIGAVGNNGAGVVGVNWQVSLLPIKFISATGSGSTSDAVAAIEYATSMGVDIMSNSWGGGGFSRAMSDAILDASAHDILFVAAAGNDRRDNDEFAHYPSGFEAPNVIAVAATDRRDALAVFSNYGASSVHLGAPGVDIRSTVLNRSYALFSGTSMATPHVAGAAALIRAVEPGLDVMQLKARLLAAVDPVPALAGRTVTGGRLNAFNAIAVRDTVPPGPIVDLGAADAASNSLVLRWTATGNNGGSGTAADYDIRVSSGPIDAARFPGAARLPFHGRPAPSGSPEVFLAEGLSGATTYHFAVRALDATGNAGPVSNDASGTTLPDPTFASTPDSFDLSLRSGESATRILVLRNSGEGTLDWTLTPLMTPVAPAGPGTEEAGGPDVGGYRFIDSDQAGGPDFVWQDIRATGIPLDAIGVDFTTNEIPFGFAFPFYDGVFGGARLSSNGCLSFTSPFIGGDNLPLPSSAAPGNLIAPFWDHLRVTENSSVVYRRDASKFTVQYTDVESLDGGGRYTFQVSLHASGVIGFDYLSMEEPTDGATIGIQDATRAVGLQVASDAPYLHDGLAVRISRLPQWLTAFPTSGRLLGGESREVAVGVDAVGLPSGRYEGNILARTNDPARPAIGHAVALAVNGGPAIAATPAAIDFGGIFIHQTWERPLEVRNTGSEVLAVAGWTSTHPAVTTDFAPFHLPPGGARRITVRATPVANGPLLGELHLESDAGNGATFAVPVRASVTDPPVIGADPDALDVTLPGGTTTTRRVRLVNSGGADFPFKVAISEEGAIAGAPVESSISAAEAGGAFERLPPSPKPIGCLIADPETGTLYAREWNGNSFFRFRASAGTWETLATSPVGEGLQECGAAILKGRIYTIFTSNLFGTIGAYDIATNRWALVPSPASNTTNIASDGSRLYVVSAYSHLMAFDPISGEAELLPAPPMWFAYGGLQYFEGALYGHSGRGIPTFMRYDLVAHRWDVLPPVPGYPLLGGAIDPIRREYACYGDEPNALFRYSIDDGTWSISPQPLFPFGEGGIAWLPAPRPAIYFAEGKTYEDPGRTGFARQPDRPAFLAVDRASGVVPVSGSVDLNVTLGAPALRGGDYQGAIFITGTGLSTMQTTVPVGLHVAGVPDLRIAGEPIVLESSRDFGSPGAVTTHAFDLPIPAGAGARLEVLGIGEFALQGDRADVVADDQAVGSIGGAQFRCDLAATGYFTLDPSRFASLASDGHLDVRVTNSASVRPNCSANRHVVRVRYDGPADLLDFGQVPLGGARTRSIVLHNDGTDTVIVTGVTALPQEFRVSVTGASIPPGGSVAIPIRFAPEGTGARQGALLLRSNDADLPEAQIGLRGAGVPAPRLHVDPSRLDVPLRSGDATVEVLRLGNEGLGPASYRVSVAEEAPATRFEILAPSPAPLLFLADDGGADVLYAQRAAGKEFYRYLARANRWETLAPAPIDPGSPSSPVARPRFAGAAVHGGRVYTAYAGSDRLGVYDIAGDRWTTIPSPSGMKTAAIASDGFQYLYLQDPDRFVRFDPATGARVTLRDYPDFYSATWFSGSLRVFEGRVYANPGEGAPEIGVYDLAGGYWNIQPVLYSPGPRYAGAIDPGARNYYACGTHPSRTIARYAIDAKQWFLIPAPTLPEGTDDSCDVAWLAGPNPALYFTQGVHGTGFARLLTPAPFVSIAPVSGLVPPGGTQALEARLSAALFADGARAAEVRIDSDDPAAPRLSVPIALQSIPMPRFAASAASFDFGTVPVGGSAARRLTIRNRGDAPLDVTLRGTLVFLPSPASLSLPPQGEEAVDLAFAPAAAGEASAAVEITTNDPLAPVLTLSVAGRGQAAPVIDVASGAPRTRVLSGESAHVPIPIANRGGGPLDVTAMVPASGSCVPAEPSAALITDRVSGRLLRVDLRNRFSEALVLDLAEPGLGIAVDSTGTTAYITEEGGGRLSAIDLAARTVTPIASGLERPTGLALSRDGAQVFVAETGRDRIVAITLATGAVAPVADIAAPQGIALGPGDRWILVAQEDGRIAVLDRLGNATRTLAVLPGRPAGLAWEAGEIVVVDSLSGDLLAVDAESGAVRLVACCNTGAAGVALDGAGGAFLVRDTSLSRTDVRFGTGAPLLQGMPAGAGIALLPAAGCPGRIADIAPAFGRVDPGSTLTLDLTLQAAGLGAGEYPETIEIRSNDPWRPLVRVATVLEVVTDEDADGVLDMDDNCPAAGNPGQEDADRDGLGDPCDNCAAAANGDQADGDGDGFGDLCDVCPLHSGDQADADADGHGDACDVCPDAADPLQTDSNQDGAGNACQPAASIDRILEDGGPNLEVWARTVDPQNDPIRGTVDIFPGAALYLRLADTSVNGDCASADPLGGAPGEGIAFYYGTPPMPTLFDADAILGCGDGRPDFVLAAATCDSPNAFFDVVAPLAGRPLPAPVCVRRAGDSSGGIDLMILSYAPDGLLARYAREVSPVLTVPFVGSLPRRIELRALGPGSYVLALTVTDDRTPPVIAERLFRLQRETTLLFRNGPDRRPHARLPGPVGAPVAKK